MFDRRPRAVRFTGPFDLRRDFMVRTVFPFSLNLALRSPLNQRILPLTALRGLLRQDGTAQ
jgi:hypothetical protein